MPSTNSLVGETRDGDTAEVSSCQGLFFAVLILGARACVLGFGVRACVSRCTRSGLEGNAAGVGAEFEWGF